MYRTLQSEEEEDGSAWGSQERAYNVTAMWVAIKGDWQTVVGKKTYRVSC